MFWGLRMLRVSYFRASGRVFASLMCSPPFFRQVIWLPVPRRQLAQNVIKIDEPGNDTRLSLDKKNTRRQAAPSVSFYVFARTAAHTSGAARNDVVAKSIDTYPEVNELCPLDSLIE